MKNLVLNSNKMDSNSKILIDNFKLNSNSKSLASKFELAFIIDNIIYKYGFKILNNEIIEEWLEQNKKRFTNLFYKNSSDGNSINIGNSFKEGKSIPKNKLRKNALFLPLVASYNGEISNKIMKYLNNINIISGEKFSYNITLDMIEDKINKEKINKFLQIADLGIKNFIIEEKDITIEMKKLLEIIPKAEIKFEDIKEVNIKTSHSKYNENYEFVGLENFDMEYFESEGTKKFFSLAGPIIDTLNEGKILFIDELDSKLHPLMIKFIVDFFNSKEKNPKNAQLIINTHNINLMKKDTLRRDQIWFVEKNKYGESELYSLDEYKDEKSKKIRNDESYEKNYLLGKYGAIPNLYEEYLVFNEFFTNLGGENFGK